MSHPRLRLPISTFIRITGASVACGSVQLEISGTCSQSVYDVMVRTNLLTDDWELAMPDGDNCAGENGSMIWVDTGAAGRCPSSVTQLFYRVTLDETP